VKEPPETKQPAIDDPARDADAASARKSR